MSDESYTDGKFGVRMTHVFPFAQPIQTDATGHLIVGTPRRDNLFRMPFKAKLCKIGIMMSPNTHITSSSWGGFRLQFAGAEGTVLATFVPGTAAHSGIGDGVASGYFCATGESTGIAPETATRIKKGRVVRPGMIGDEPGLMGTSHISHFFEYERVYDLDA